MFPGRLSRTTTPLALAATAILGGCAAPLAPAGPQASAAATVASPAATRILDPAAAQRLRANNGLTLQWIGWNERGTAAVSESGGVWTLRGAQIEPGGPGRLFLDGTVTEIGADYFLFAGTVRILETPDRGRVCEKRDVWRFAVTQNRPYWRIRTFEWCDGLTDYIDIYF